MHPSSISRCPFVVLFVSLSLVTVRAQADDDRQELAQKLVNPLASLISVPIQYNVDSGIGPFDVEREQINLQPVVPIELAGRWKLLSRTVVPLVAQAGAASGGGRFDGLGDVTASLFLTPKAPAAGGWLLGAGPVIQAPTGTDARLTGGRWNVGPTAVAVRQIGPWTYGALANHLWSAAGDADRDTVGSTFLQPFLGYVTKTHTTIALNAEATYGWTRDEWSVPLHLTLSQLLEVGPQALSVSLAARYWAAGPAGGPEAWGLRAGVTLLFRPEPPG